MHDLLCYGDSNTWGCVPVTGLEPPRRFPRGERWPGVLSRELGAGYGVVEEGLNGRTTVWEDPLEPHRNGRAYLPAALLSHMPLDLVILMLGTNDLKHRFCLSAREVAEGAGLLVDDIRASASGPGGDAAAVLLVCPPLLRPVDRFADDFEGAAEKSRGLSERYRAVAGGRGCAFLDAGAHVSVSDTDGIHLDADAHARLGSAVAEAVREILE